MPPPKDLTGQRFGRLVVIKFAGHVQYGGQARAWLCRCDCGEEEIFPQKRLPYCVSNSERRDQVCACSACMSVRICEECGRTFQSAQFKACCSPECLSERKRKAQLDSYYRRIERDPELNKRRNAKVRERAERDPEYARRRAEFERRAREKKQERLRSDPEYAEYVRARTRAAYQKRAEEIQARRRADRVRKLASMTPEERDAERLKMREFWRDNAQTRREYLRSNPEKHIEFLERFRTYSRDRYRKKALESLMAIGNQILKKAEKA